MCHRSGSFFLQCLHDLHVEFLPKRFLVDSSASPMNAHFVLRVPEELQVSPCSLLLILQGIASIGTSNFFPRVFHGFLELCICRMNEINTFHFFLAHFCIFLATGELAWMLFASLSTAPQTMYTLLDVFHSTWWTVWNPSTHLIDLGPLRYSNSHLYVVPTIPPRS